MKVINADQLTDLDRVLITGKDGYVSCCEVSYVRTVFGKIQFADEFDNTHEIGIDVKLIVLGKDE